MAFQLAVLLSTRLSGRLNEPNRNEGALMPSLRYIRVGLYTLRG